MDDSTSLPPSHGFGATGETHAEHHHEAGHEHEHHELGFWRKYIFSTDHKVIGIQYGICGLIFLFVGFNLMMMMRWQLAYPGQPVPGVGWLAAAIQNFLDQHQAVPGQTDWWIWLRGLIS